MKGITFIILSLNLLFVQAQETWKELNTTPGESAVFFDFATDDVVFATFEQTGTQEAVIKKSIDNGMSWSLIPHALDTAEFMAFDALNDSTIYACYRQFGSSNINGSKVFRSSDGGNSWTNLTPDTTETGYGWMEIEFTSDSVGYWAVAEKLYRTSDSGQTWITIDLPTGYNAISMDFQDDTTGVIGTWDGTFGYHGGLLFTRDGGQTWADTAFLSENYTTMASVRMDGTSKMYGSTAGYNPYQNHILFTSDDQGNSWYRLPIPDTLPDFRLVGFDIQDGQGYLIEESMGDSYLYLTEDGGDSWAYLQTITGIDLWYLTLSEGSGILGGAPNRIFILDMSTNISQPIVPIPLTVFPNPASESIRISYAEKGMGAVKLWNMEGQKVWEAEYYPEIEIPVYALPQGIYLIEVKIGENYGRSRFIKQ